MNCTISMFGIIWQPSGLHRVTAFIEEIVGLQGSIKDLRISNKADLDGQTIDDVTGVCILEYEDLNKIPKNLSERFQNIQAFEISRCGLNGLIREDLQNLKSLRELKITHMDIEILPGDLFNDLKHLEIIELQKNKIYFINENTFEGLKNLKYVDLRENPKINAIYASEEFEVEKDFKVKRIVNLKEFIEFIQVKFQPKVAKNKPKNPIEHKPDSGKTLKSNRNPEIPQTTNIGKVGSSKPLKRAESLVISFKNDENASKGAIRKVKNNSKELPKTRRRPVKKESSSESSSSSEDDSSEEENLKEETKYVWPVSDFTISVSDTKFKVHKHVLAIRSKTFAKLIKNDPNADSLDLDNIEAGIFKIILDYIYNNKMPQNVDKYSENVVAAAEKLRLEPLKLRVQKLLENVN